MRTTQIEQIANLFDDLQPRTSNMVAKELQLKNGSVSKHLCTLVHKWRLCRVEKNDICLVTGKKAAYYNAIIWTKKGLK